MIVAEQTEKDIDATRLEYVPVAVRTQLLFFCVSDLSNVDPMYQYSLEWFLGIFLAGIANSERAGRATVRTARTFAGDEHLTVLKSAAASTHFVFICPHVCVVETVEMRIENINEYFTFSLYSNVCRSLFEKHKLMFAFLLCTRIMMNDNKINMVSVGGVFIREARRGRWEHSI